MAPACGGSAQQQRPTRTPGVNREGFAMANPYEHRAKETPRKVALTAYYFLTNATRIFPTLAEIC